ncbi:sensor domain-containing diguanylate cyclase [Methyloversatilis discipulorum]|uniref:sensor domain-containing diguanylate cyclase n=1 Tax=Methyloversatilis discipulorum TaxID=1119528 RepID=UPI003F33E376
MLALLVLAVLDIRLFMFVDAARTETLERARDTLRVSVDVVARRMDQQLATYDRLLSGIGEGVRLHGGIQAEPDLALHRLLVRRHALNPELRSLFLVRHDGTMAAMSLSFPAPDLDVSARDYFLAQSGSGADEHRLFIGPAIVSKLTGKHIFPLSRRVENDGNRFLGVAAAAVDPEQLTTLLSEHGLPAAYTLSVFLRDGHRLACLPRRSDCLDGTASDTPLFRTLLPAAADGLFARQRLLDERPGPAAYATSDAYGVVVAATADEGMLLQSWRRNLGGYLVLGVASNLAFAALIWFAFRQMQRRRLALQQLADANQELENRVARRTDQLRRSEDRARTFMNTARDAVVVVDSDSCIVEFNRAAEVLFGYSVDEVAGRRLDMLMPPSGAATHRRHVQAANASAEARAMNRGREVTARHKDGREFPIDVTVGSSGEGAQSFHVGIIRDISERKRLELELQRQASTDGLTGVLNRRAFTAESERLISVALRHGRPLSLMVIDADHFKKVNDVFGHPTGDTVLKALALTLGQALRTSDVLGRLGGEEFGIVLPETDATGAREVGERLLQAVRERRIEHDGHTLNITVSIGATVLGAGDDGFESAFLRADRALYEAKHGGRDRITISLPETAAH